MEPVLAPAPEPSVDSSNGMVDYFRLQRRLQLFTLLLAGVAVTATAILGDLSSAAAVLVGAGAGILYLGLLSRSVTRLGGDRRSVGKAQLLVPIALVLLASRLPQLELLPALLGFLLYKPAVILQALLDA